MANATFQSDAANFQTSLEYLLTRDEESLAGIYIDVRRAVIAMGIRTPAEIDSDMDEFAPRIAKKLGEQQDSLVAKCQLCLELLRDNIVPDKLSRLLKIMGLPSYMHIICHIYI